MILLVWGSWWMWSWFMELRWVWSFSTRGLFLIVGLTSSRGYLLLLLLAPICFEKLNIWFGVYLLIGLGLFSMLGLSFISPSFELGLLATCRYLKFCVSLVFFHFLVSSGIGFCWSRCGGGPIGKPGGNPPSWLMAVWSLWCVFLGLLWMVGSSKTCISLPFVDYLR